MSNVLDRTERLRANMTLENLFSIITENEDAVAAHYIRDGEEKSITYGDYRRRSFAAAAYLSEALGTEKRGSFIGIQQDTCPEWFSLFFGVICAGYNAILLDFTLNDEMTGYLLREAGAIGLISKAHRAISGEYRQFTVKELIDAPDAPDYKPVFGDMVALCTSGTTETSRIFVYNSESICYQVANAEMLFNINPRIICDESRRNLAFLPYHHVFGFLVGLLWMHFIAYENVYLKDRSPKCILETAQRFHITHLMSVPLLANNLCNGLEKKLAKESPVKRAAFKTMRGLSLMLQKIAPEFGMDFARNVLFKSVNEQLLGPDVRCIILGGSATPAENMKTLSALGYYTVAGFGMTETGVTSVETGLDVGKRTSGSVGRPLPSAEYKVDPNGEDPNTGEMLIRSKTLHTGRLVGGKLLPAALDEDGWFRTGDIVRLEKGNRMYVEGRVKDVIINESGENVYPDELENAFNVIEGIDQMCVLGLKKEKSSGNYEDIALVLNMGEHYNDSAFLTSVMQKVRRINATLPTLKRINRVLIVPEPFATASGIKIKRIALKKELEEGTRRYREVDLHEKDMVLSEEHKGTAAAPKPAPAAPAPAPVRSAAPEEEPDEENGSAVPAAEAPAPAAPAPAKAVKTDPEELARLKAEVRKIYADVLDTPVTEIGDDMHFIDDLGGDSLQVMEIGATLEEKYDLILSEDEYGRCATVNDLTSLLYTRLTGNTVEEAAPEEAVPAVIPITRFEDAPEYIAFQKRLEALKEDGLENPYFIAHDSPLLDKSFVDGQWMLDFGSYNYVGMSGRKEVNEAAKAAIDKYGTSASGSRLLAGEKTLHKELEAEIARWKHTETALVLVGGHSTNVTCVGNFCGKGDLIVYDAIAHNSIAEGCRLSAAESKPFPHNDVAALDRILRNMRSKFAKVLIVIEGAYSMDGDIAPVPEIVALKKKYGCFLMVDEAHSSCVIGRTGGGVDEYFGLAPDDIDIKMGTLSKGLGTCGGYLAGSHAIIDYMRYSLPGFVFSVGISPALAAASLTAIRLLRDDPSIMERLARNIRVFVEEAHKRGFNTCLAKETAIIPILVGKDEDAWKLSDLLRAKGVIVPPAVYPAVPKNKARLRFCVISEHTPEEIVTALDALAECAKEAGIELPA